MTRLRLGVGRLAKWRHQVLGDGDGLCTAGCNEPETVEHVLLLCPHWQQQRETLWVNCQLRGDDRNMCKLLAWHGTGDCSVKDRALHLRTFWDDIGLREWIIMV